MATPPKPPGRVVGRSTTGTSPLGTRLRLEDPLDKGYLCSKMCRCNSGAALFSLSGDELKQRCTTVSIWKDEEENLLVWRYKAEVGYSMKAFPPAPLMSSKQPNRPSRFPLGAAMGQGVLKRDLEGKMQKGLLKIPDCIILKITGFELAAMRSGGIIDWTRLMPVHANIETVLEIKFAGDDLDREQEEAYMKIAGPERFRLMEITDCDCDTKREKPATQPVRSPVTTSMPSLFETLPFFPPIPPNYPPPQPVRPQYGPLVPAAQSTALSSVLKAAVLTAGVILLTVIVVALLPEIAIGAAVVTVVRTVGTFIALAVMSQPAISAPDKKKELK